MGACKAKKATMIFHCHKDSWPTFPKPRQTDLFVDLLQTFLLFVFDEYLMKANVATAHGLQCANMQSWGGHGFLCITHNFQYSEPVGKRVLKNSHAYSCALCGHSDLLIITSCCALGPEGNLRFEYKNCSNSILTTGQILDKTLAAL